MRLLRRPAKPDSSRHDTGDDLGNNTGNAAGIEIAVLPSVAHNDSQINHLDF